MAAFNICHPMFGTHIQCDKPSADDYEVTNLLSVKYNSKGYLAESFIRPPVSLSLEFPCNIEIDKIILHGTVGAQTSTSFELFTGSVKATAWREHDKGFMLPGDIVYHPVGKIWGNKGGIFCFSNKYFRSRSPYNTMVPMPGRWVGGDCVYQDIRGRSQQDLTNVSHLLIKITRTLLSCVPAIGWLEVWGQPAASTSTTSTRNFCHIYHNIMKPTRSMPKASSLPEHQSNVSVSLSNSSLNNVPDDFLDPITWEVMALPMLLPSGLTVDESTIEKHSAEEAKWGRKPSDPFTGVLFTSSCKPVPNTALKVRLDHYLLRHDVQTAGRTIGRASDLHNRHIVQQAAEAGDILVQNSNLTHRSHDYTQRNSKVELSHVKRGAADIGGNKSKRSKLETDTNVDSMSSKPKQNMDSGGPSTSFRTVDLTGSDSDSDISREGIIDLTEESGTREKHEKQMKDDLDSLLDATLSSMPSFQCPKPRFTEVNQSQGHKNDAQDSNVLSSHFNASASNCAFCKKSVLFSGLYQLLCLHFTCRQCLLVNKADTTQLICATCGTTVQTKDIIKANR